MVTQLALRLPDDVLADLDWLVLRCSYENRTEAMRDAIIRAVAEERRRQVDEQLVEAYTRQPQTAAELAGITAQPWPIDNNTNNTNNTNTNNNNNNNNDNDDDWAELG